MCCAAIEHCLSRSNNSRVVVSIINGREDMENRRASFRRSRDGMIMGVLNVTPDSFSDGGDFFDIIRR